MSKIEKRLRSIEKSLDLLWIQDNTSHIGVCVDERITYAHDLIRALLDALGLEIEHRESLYLKKKEKK